MQPTVEVLPPEEPRLMLSGRKRRGWVDPSPPPVIGPEGVLSLVAPRKAGRKSKYATPEGRAEIQKAFEKYRDQGELRSLAKVSAELNLPVRHVRMWSAKYKWGNQIARTNPSPAPFTVSNKSLHENLAEEALKLVKDVLPIARLKLAEMTTIDPDTGKTMLTKSASMEAITKLINTGERCMTVLEKDVNRQKTGKEIESPDSGNGKDNKSGVTVNFNILGLSG